MKIVLIFILVIGFIVFHFTVPSISAIAQCYDTFSYNTDDLAFNTRSQNWNQEKICQVKYDDISNLDSCVTNVSNSAPSQIRNIIITSYKSILRLIRPNIKGIDDQKALQNSTCADYTDYIFP